MRIEQTSRGYLNMALLDDQGRIRLAVPAQAPLADASDDQHFQAALASQRPFITDLHAHGNGANTPQQIRMEVYVPILEVRPRVRRVVGMWRLQLDPHAFLYPLIQAWPIPSETAETLLVERSGDDALCINDLRHTKKAAFGLRLPLRQDRLPAAAVILGKRGCMDGVDYRGAPVIAYIQAVPTLPWFIVAKVDRDEAFASLRQQLWFLGSAVAALAMAAALTFGLLWMRRDRHHLRRQLALERERRSLTALLAEEKERLQVTLRNIGDGVVATDTHGTVTLLNNAAENLTGWRREEARGRPITDVLRVVHETTRQPIPYTLDGGPHTGEVVRLGSQAVLIGRDGTERCIADSCTAIRGPAGTVLGTVIVFRDVTEQREAEARLRQAEKLEAIGLLASGIAHDFNNQLAAIMGHADLLVQSLRDPKLGRYAESIVKASRRAADLTHQLLAFARQGAYHPVPTDVHDIVTEVAHLLERSVDKRIRVVLSLEALHHTVLGDATQLQNAILNVAINGRDAMRQGGVLTMGTRMVEVSEPDADDGLDAGHYLQLYITDTGQGMEEGVLEKIFQPFFTTKELGQGTGLGLAAVYGTVRRHGGAIRVTSKLGCGSTFAIYLSPVADAPPVQEGTPAVVPPRQGARILVADHEKLVREFVAAALRIDGHEVTLCENGQEALDCYRESWRQIDLVILDVMMPIMGGPDAFMAMRDINPRVKVVMLSGYSREDIACDLLDGGILKLVQKPVTLQTLRDMVATALMQEESLIQM